MASSRPTPIFQIGFNKCGTLSLHHFLVQSQIPSLHWERRELAKRICARMDAGEDPIQDFPNAVGFTDMMAFDERRMLEPYKRFDYLHLWYPDALFILNTRSRENWIASRTAHANRGFQLISQYAKYLKISEDEVPDYWRAEWDVHHIAARAYFSGEENFLEFDIEREDPRTLVSFIGNRYPQCLDTPFQVLNRTPR